MKKVLFVVVHLFVFCVFYLQSKAQVVTYSGLSGTSTSITGVPNETVSTLQTYGLGTGSLCSSGGLSGLIVDSTITSYIPGGPRIFFKVQPNVGFQLNPMSMSVGFRRNSTGAKFVRMAYSLDNGTTWVSDGVTYNITDNPCGSSVFADWAGGVLPIVTNTVDGIIFAFFPFGAVNSTGTLQINSIAISGNVTPVCTGTPASGYTTTNLSSACPSSLITVSLFGYSPSVTLQWQSSPDSLTWTDVLGVVAPVYSFSGLASTKYFRCVSNCAITGLSTASPGVKVSYFGPVCVCTGFSSGAVVANMASACSTNLITLVDTGSAPVSGLNYQWQKSSDSTVWTNISGATSDTYSFSGLFATSYFRCITTCIYSGTSLATAGKKITYSPICSCSGSPSGGTATASTGFCGGCSVNLNLVGAPTLLGIGYQWERSFVSASSWTNIPAATSTTATTTNTDAFDYRVKVTCAYGGGVTYSSIVSVGYPYAIISDSVGTPHDTLCSATSFYTLVNGVSSSLRLKTLYGDGTKDSSALFPEDSTSYSGLFHFYRTPGDYITKQILYHNNVAQDSIVHNFHHDFCNTLPIRFYIDYNGDCAKSISEPYNSIPISVKIDSNGVAIDTISITSGLYYPALGLVGDIYNFTVLPGSRYVSCPVTGSVSFVIADTVNGYNIQYLGLSCSSGSLSDIQVNAIVPITGRINQLGYIYVRNNYCMSTDVTLTLKYSFKYDGYFASGVAPSSLSASTVSWTIPAVTALNQQSSMYFKPQYASALLTAGDTVTEEITVTPNFGTDCETSNNIIIRVDTVKASCDPNMIEVAPAGCFDTATTFQYTVHFENTGNDTAYNVYVLDTLSDYLDPASMNLVMSSAEVMNIYPYTEGGYNIVKFDFPNIKLLDSAWKGLNDGAFIYTIKRRAGMPEGASIFSRVGIYFDYNEVVMTNTVQNLKGCPVTAVVGTALRPQVLLYPNPVTDELTIKTSRGEFASFAISNIVGVQVATGAVDKEVTRTHTAHLSPGVYYVTLRGAAGTEVRKFVKR